MSRDLRRAIQIEVMVPHLRLPTFSSTPSGELPVSPGGTDVDLDAPAQVYLHVIPTPGQTPPQPAYGLTKSKALTYTSKRGPFHLHHLRYHFQQGQGLLLQILRHVQDIFSSASPEALEPATSHIDDELNCILEYRSATEISPITIIPGIKRIMITLDKDNQPCHYSVDGADS